MQKGMTPTDEHVGERIRIRRMILGMSQTRSRRAVGLTFQQMQKYEKAADRVSVGRLQQFAKVLDVPLSFFLDGAPEARVVGRRKASAKGTITPLHVADFLSSREGQDIIKIFNRIKDRRLSRKMTNVAQEIAAKTSH
jgi:transcriptional regulator with XRE-family HTH domain